MERKVIATSVPTPAAACVWAGYPLSVAGQAADSCR